MFRRSFTAVLLALWFCSLSSQAQVCGDANNNGSFEVTDFVDTWAYIALFGPEVTPSADVDRHLGITVSDIFFMTNKIFKNGPDLVCDPSLTYSFSLSSTDTVFLPTMVGIPNGLNEVYLPVRTHLDSTTHGLNMFFRGLTGGDFDKFQLTEILENPDDPITPAFADAMKRDDTVHIISVDLMGYEHKGLREMWLIHFERVAPGVGAAGIEIIDPPTIYNRFGVAKSDGDLLVPATPNLDVEVTPDTLFLAGQSLDFSVAISNPVIHTLDLSFSASFGDIAFDLSGSDSWIDIPPAPIGGWQTPVTIPIGVDITGLAENDYSGTITVTNLDPTNTHDSFGPIPVNLHLTQLLFGLGDIDCDGQVSISDISRYIDFLFISGSPLVPCE